MTTISKDFIFNFENNISIGETSKILKEYQSGFLNSFSLRAQLPIFLDTNILLNYYGMSNTDKAALKSFFNENIAKIHITQQIEKEFQRNRISTIQNYFEELDKIKLNFKNDLQDGVKNKFNNILQSKIVEKDFPEIMSSITSIFSELETKLFNNVQLQDTVNKKIDETINSQKDMEFLDPILDIYKDFVKTPDLIDEEISCIQESYNKNLDIYNETKETIKWKFSFPGCGERKEKKEKDPFGDYIIFHEIIKFMKDNNQNVIFLTRDVTKSDWLQKNRKPFIHYIEKVYQLTGHFLYIFDATDLLEMISFENIYKIDKSVDNFQPYEDEENDEVDEHKYLERFKNIVSSIYLFFEEEMAEEDLLTRVENRSVNGHDVDLILENKSGLKEGVIVFDCQGTKKGYRKSLQRRVNACNKLVQAGIVDRSTVVVVMKFDHFDRGFDYSEMRRNCATRILTGCIRNENGLVFIQNSSILLDC